MVKRHDTYLYFLFQGSKCKVVCTQPRRISAISIAERVADERDDTTGGSGSSIGYQIRLESRLPRTNGGSILYCTTGVTLQWLRNNPTLEDISHIILDEIHERDILSDFLITILKGILPKRPELKVILMSATLNAQQFSKYFHDSPTINIPGFTFPVQEFYLEDVLEMTNFYIEPKREKQNSQPWHRHTRRGKEDERQQGIFEDFIAPFLRDIEGTYSSRTISSLSSPSSEEMNLELVATLIHHIHVKNDEGAILVFLTGWDDISKLHKLLTEDRHFRLNSDRTTIYPLHSLMPTVNQKQIFSRPPKGVRKIVLATNIAETSITIDDIVYVINCGKIKLTNFDADANISTLKPEWISLANARQRRGRAGRVQDGICYHLYTRAREMTLQQFVTPEILRTRLEEVILHIKILELGRVSPFLRKVMESPNGKSVDNATSTLFTINALNSDEQLTPLGFHLAELPMDPQTGKMILLGAIFSCLDPILSVAASLSFKDAFVIPLGKEELADKRRVQLSRGMKSDHLMLANAIAGWENSTDPRQFCWENFLSESTLRMLSNMKRQFAQHLYKKRFLRSDNVKDKDSNRNSGNSALVRAIVAAGLYPNVAKIKIKRNKHRGSFPVLQTQFERKVEFHPKSVNAKEGDFAYPWIVYHLKMKSSSTYIYDASMVSPLALIFFGKSVQRGIEHFSDDTSVETLNVDEFVKFNCDRGTTDLIKDLRGELNKILEDKVNHPGVTDWDPHSRQGAVLNAIIQLLTAEVDGIQFENDCD